jgi:hypothetical protein
VILILKMKNFFNTRFNRKGFEISASTIIILIICIAVIIFAVIFAGSLRTYIISIIERFTLRGR